MKMPSLPNIFQKKSKPKTLTLREMWELYEVLKPSIRNSQEFLVDEVGDMLDNLSGEDFLQSLRLMYNTVSFSQNPVQLVTLFIAGLKRNEIFLFDSFVKGFDGRSK